MKRGEVWLVLLSSAQGSEQKGARPVVIVSPNSMNRSLDTKVVIPLTTQKKDWPSRVAVFFQQREGQAMCEQIRDISSRRFYKKLGKIPTEKLIEIMSTIGALYAEI